MKELIELTNDYINKAFELAQAKEMLRSIFGQKPSKGEEIELLSLAVLSTLTGTIISKKEES